MYCFTVPLEPLGPRIRNVSSRHIEVTWSPPSNGKSLGIGKAKVTFESSQISAIQQRVGSILLKKLQWLALNV